MGGRQLGLGYLGVPVDPPPFGFKGASYVPHLDGDRLETQLGKIVAFMLEAPGTYRTVAEISAELGRRYPAAGFPENSVQAQLRNAEKAGYRKAKRRRGDPGRGVFEFALFQKERP